MESVFGECEKNPWRRGGFNFAFAGSDYSRIMSDRLHIENDVLAVFSKFLIDIGWLFCVAGAIFGEVGEDLLLLRVL